MLRNPLVALAAALAIGVGSSAPATADLTAFVANVSFDKDASLGTGQGLGLRWGKSSSILGGETSLTLAFPKREIKGVSEETATALLYEGRILLNVPISGKLSPFVGVGFGAVTVTSTDVPDGANSALKSLSETQTNSAFSWGGGVRTALSERLYARLDFRQYVAFSVSGLAKERIAAEVGDELGVEIETKDSTVQHNEVSLGVSFKF